MPPRTDYERWLRERAIVLARDSGLTWVAIGKRHGISGSRAQQIYTEATWPTDVAMQRRAFYEAQEQFR